MCHAFLPSAYSGDYAMSMPLFERVWTFDDLQELPDDGNRYEVIDGELFVSPSPTLDHQAALLALYGFVNPYVVAENLGYTYVAPADVTFAPRNSVQPDLFVLPFAEKRRPRHFREVGRLLLAAEILSPSTARADRVAKRHLFHDEGVPEYWVVDLDSRTIERTTPQGARPDVIADTLSWLPTGASQPLRIDVVAYFAAVLDR